MQFTEKADYEEMSLAAADEIIKTVRDNSYAAIVLATGHSPLLAYRFFVRKAKDQKLDVSNARFIKLDEWIGPDADSEATCECFIRNEIIGPLHIAEDHYLHFSMNPDDCQGECDRVEAAYLKLGKIDLVVLGIGMNGHLGLNEPAEILKCRANVVCIDAKTKHHEMLTHTAYEVSRGMTLGIADLFRGEEILLLADGKDKSLEYLYNDKITTKVPVSLLKLHPNCHCLINRSCFS
ncbi:MAG: 6-phosphogluconolactonase [Lachnospiraceae bacterium]|jgi:galactosamine-6-phosphate isomerase|nr:6-phosphogluconolactonase [Lachnospiraceae bacterium]